MVKVYVYNKCSTCRKALAFLDREKIDYITVPIRETPPSVAELKCMAGKIEGGSGKLFSTSGYDYREQRIKDRLPDLSDAERFNLLHSNGNLVKRPFAIGPGIGLVGFKEEQWKGAFR